MVGSSERETTLSRSIDARLRRLEVIAGRDGPATELDRSIEALSGDDLSCLLHQLYITIGEHPDSTPEQIEEAKAGRAKLEGEVLDWVKFYQQPNIAAAVAKNRAAGLKSCERDWLGLAYDFDLIPPPANWRRAANLAERAVHGFIAASPLSRSAGPRS